MDINLYVNLYICNEKNKNISCCESFMREISLCMKLGILLAKGVHYLD